MSTPVSSCCRAELRSYLEWNECEKCGKPCDAVTYRLADELDNDFPDDPEEGMA